ncbi:MAG TPA: outer membrane lipoprotein carrier protein LolA [Chryseosolibacter sp.]
MRSLFTATLLLIVCGQLFGQHAGYQPVADLSSFKKQFMQEAQKINSITSNFRQEKTLTALTETIVSTGVFSFKRANKVRMEYKKPFAYMMVMNGEKMLVKDEGHANTVNLKSNKLFQQVNKIVIDCVQGTILDSKDFTSRVFENPKAYLLEMTPTTKTLKGFFQTIVLIVEKKDYSVDSIKMNEPSGDTTILTFTEKKLNAQVPDEIFAF